jgi:curved DNA-binding protein CbpA
MRFMLRKVSGVQFPEDGADIDEHLYLAPQQALQGGPHAYYLRRQSKKLVVKIPVGIRAGQRIRLEGMGEKGKAGGKPGDLFLKVHIRKPMLKSIKDFFIKGRKAKS